MNNLLPNLYKIFFLIVFIQLGIIGNAQTESVYQYTFQNFTKTTYHKNFLKYSSLNTSNFQEKELMLTSKIDSSCGDSVFKCLERNFTLTYNQKVQEYINLYQNDKNIHFLNYLINYHSPTILNLLNKYNLPNELLFVPVVCSGFNPNSSNELGGTGYWHLTYPQALKFGLEVNKFIDERKDLEKSTIAACKYLNHLFSIYQNWDLAIAAYSCGINNINNLLNRHQVSKFDEIYPYLNTNTRDLFYAGQAMIYCYAQNNSNYNKLEPHFELDTFYIEYPLKFKAIQDVADISSKELLFFNKTLNKEMFPKKFKAIFPKNKIDKFYQLCDSIYYYQDSILLKPIKKEEIETIDIPTGTEPITYTVKSGDVLGIIASKYNVKVSQIQDWNNLNSTRINIGQNLLIYSKSSTTNRVKETKAPEPIYKDEEKQISKALDSIENYITYTVKSGDNLWVIAKKYPGVSAQNIMDLNGIDGNIDIGQILKIKKK